MKKIKNIDAIANGAGIVTSACIGYTLNKVVMPLLPNNMSLIGRIAVLIGGSAISGYIGGKIGIDVTDNTKCVLELINDMLPEEKELYASQEFHTL